MTTTIATGRCARCGKTKPISAMRQEWPGGIRHPTKLYLLCNDDDNCHAKWILDGSPIYERSQG